MNEKDLKAMIDQYRPLILGEGASNPEHAILALCRDVERTTRANAAKVAFENANRISNLNHE